MNGNGPDISKDSEQSYLYDYRPNPKFKSNDIFYAVFYILVGSFILMLHIQLWTTENNLAISVLTLFMIALLMGLPVLRVALHDPNNLERMHKHSLGNMLLRIIFFVPPELRTQLIKERQIQRFQNTILLIILGIVLMLIGAA